MPDTLSDWLIYLETLHPKTIALGLERVAQVRQRLALEPDFPIIVVGGTNGKGSVCALLESILHAAGYRVGCYTSPHLLQYNERVRIAKKQVSDAELCASFEMIEQARCGHPPSCRGRAGEGVEAHEVCPHPNRHGANTTPKHKSACASRFPHPNLPPLAGEGTNESLRDFHGNLPHVRGKEPLSSSHEVPLTYFEFGTLAAMQCFIEHKVDVAVLEVGLGGRLDAVNVFDSDCAVVTSVDIDHTDYLGDTREQIAFEKAGIFRKDCVAICADADVPQAVTDYAEKIGAELWCIGREFGIHLPSPAFGGGVGGEGRGQWDYRSKVGARNALPYPALRGAFQTSNACAALAALDALKERLPVSMGAVRRGLVEVQLAGRFQFVPGRPALILDVAHNPHAARTLAQNLANLPPCPHSYAVFAMLKDKDMAGVAAALDPFIDTWLVAGIAAPRGAAVDELAEVLRKIGVRGDIQTFPGVIEALHHACNTAGENDRITAFGSFYTVAEVMAASRKKL